MIPYRNLGLGNVTNWEELRAQQEKIAAIRRATEQAEAVLEQCKHKLTEEDLRRRAEEGRLAERILTAGPEAIAQASHFLAPDSDQTHSSSNISQPVDGTGMYTPSARIEEVQESRPSSTTNASHNSGQSTYNVTNQYQHSVGSTQNQPQHFPGSYSSRSSSSTSNAMPQVSNAPYYYQVFSTNQPNAQYPSSSMVSYGQGNSQWSQSMYSGTAYSPTPNVAQQSYFYNPNTMSNPAQSTASFYATSGGFATHSNTARATEATHSQHLNGTNATRSTGSTAPVPVQQTASTVQRNPSQSGAIQPVYTSNGQTSVTFAGQSSSSSSSRPRDAPPVQSISRTALGNSGNRIPPSSSRSNVLEAKPSNQATNQGANSSSRLTASTSNSVNAQKTVASTPTTSSVESTRTPSTQPRMEPLTTNTVQNPTGVQAGSAPTLSATAQGKAKAANSASKSPLPQYAVDIIGNFAFQSLAEQINFYGPQLETLKPYPIHGSDRYMLILDSNRIPYLITQASPENGTKSRVVPLFKKHYQVPMMKKTDQSNGPPTVQLQQWNPTPAASALALAAPLPPSIPRPTPVAPSNPPISDTTVAPSNPPISNTTVAPSNPRISDTSSAIVPLRKPAQANFRTLARDILRALGDDRPAKRLKVSRPTAEAASATLTAVATSAATPANNQASESITIPHDDSPLPAAIVASPPHPPPPVVTDTPLVVEQPTGTEPHDDIEMVAETRVEVVEVVDASSEVPHPNSVTTSAEASAIPLAITKASPAKVPVATPLTPVQGGDSVPASSRTVAASPLRFFGSQQPAKPSTPPQGVLNPSPVPAGASEQTRQVPTMASSEHPQSPIPSERDTTISQHFTSPMVQDRLQQEIIDLTSPEEPEAPSRVVYEPTVSSPIQALQPTRTPVLPQVTPQQTRTPLFLPDTPSRSPPPTSQISTTPTPASTRVFITSPEKPKVGNNRLREQPFYIQVPPFPAGLSKLDYKISRPSRKQGPQHRIILESDQDSAYEQLAEEETIQVFDDVDLTSNGFANDALEREAVHLSCSRLSERKCRYNGCGVVLNSAGKLIEHLSREHRPRPGCREFVCQWQLCGKREFTARNFYYHLRSHATIPLSCAYQDCNLTFRTANQLAKHHQSNHSEADDLQPSNIPFQSVTVAPSPIRQRILATHMLEPVQMTFIPPDRHARLSRSVLKNITAASEQQVKRTYNAAEKRPLRSTTITDGEREDRATGPYSFLDSGSAKVYTTDISQPAKMRPYEDLDSVTTTAQVEAEIELWGRSDYNSEDKEGEVSGAHSSVPVSPSAQGRTDDDEEMVQLMLVDTTV